MCGGQRRRGGDKWTGGRLRGGKDGEEEAPVLGAVCVCLYVCSHTVEINLPSGLSLWNKERRKLARSDTLREKWRKTRQAQGGRVEFRRGTGGGLSNLLGPTCSYNSKHTCRDQEDWTSNVLINIIFFNPRYVPVSVLFYFEGIKPISSC